MSTAQFERLRAAAIDGRAHNVFFRQSQLERLCKGLLTEEETLRKAMTADSAYTPAEAISVLHAAVQTVKDCYATLQPERALEDEYRIAHGKDAKDGEVPFGLVYIEPEAHALLYSVCAPLSAAIAAGNCVAVVLENNLRNLPALIRKILADALDADTFCVLSSPLKDSAVLSESIVVRRANDGGHPRINELLSRSNAATVAVVDRTANIAQAARELSQAGLTFGGRSPYKPDVVLVNEFVLDEFLRSLLKECSSTAAIDGKVQLPEKKNADSLIECDLRKGNTTVASSTSLASALGTKAQEPVVTIQPIRSLDDAINLLDECQQGPYLAAIHFSDLRSAKYLSQFVDADVTFVNQIPRRLLIGPAAPQGRPFDLQHRFPVSLFTRQRPSLVQSAPADKELAVAIASADNQTAQQLLKQAKQPLKVMKRSEGGGVGFFEQAILLNLSFILVSVVTVSAAGAWQLWKYRSSR